MPLKLKPYTDRHPRVVVDRILGEAEKATPKLHIETVALNRRRRHAETLWCISVVTGLIVVVNPGGHGIVVSLLMLLYHRENAVFGYPEKQQETSGVYGLR